MSTPLKLTEQQKKGTLSAKKEKLKQSKIVLTRNETEFWPCIDQNQREKLIELLESTCNDRTKLSIGLESTIRLINQGTAHCLIIANEFSPRFCAKHLIASTLHRNPNTKVIVVERLKEITRNLLNVPAIIFAFNSTYESAAFDAFYDHLSIHAEWLVNYRRIQTKIDVSANESSRRRKKKMARLSEESPTVTLIKKSEEVKFAQQKPVTTAGSRGNAFDSSDFISFSKDTSFIASATATPLYRPIKVKRVVPNPNRKRKAT